MGSKHFENKARREWWSVHAEALRRSDLNRTEYCRRHRLNKSTFDRWLKVLDALESVRKRARERRKRAREPVSRDKHSKAVQAFWAMHVEALSWSGLNAKDYADAHHISVYTLRTWRARLDAAPLEIDWRARLHPSVRPNISSGSSSAATVTPVENGLTKTSSARSGRDRRADRRRFSDEEKLAIVMEAEQPGVSAAAVCRCHEIVTSMLFRWRVQFGFGKDVSARLATVKLAGGQDEHKPGAATAPLLLQDLLPIPDGMVAVDLSDGRRVFAPIGSDPEAVRRYVAEKEAAS